MYVGHGRKSIKCFDFEDVLRRLGGARGERRSIVKILGAPAPPLCPAADPNRPGGAQRGSAPNLAVRDGQRPSIAADEGMGRCLAVRSISPATRPTSHLQY